MSRCRRFHCTLVLVVVALAGVRGVAAEVPGVDFVREVQPIFARSCAKCHGFKKREAGLRLDQKQSAMLGGESGKRTIVPGKPQESRLIAVVDGTDHELKMPEDGKPLSAAQVATLRRWVEQGAAWPDGVDKPDPKPEHWSFVKPVRPAVPAAVSGGHAIDHFILARLRTEGLTPAAEADRHTLIRRVHLDLLGLPPSPAEVAAFVSDTGSDAYEKLIDRAMQNLAFGERWARVWLDLARYADSAGYGSDPLRPNIWPYRDWVIHAFNANMPFDQFTIAQIAGDLLPGAGATVDNLVATAMHRNTMTNTEGGTDDEEWRVAAVKDRINTTMQVWMGLTMGCAQCHTHKYDPITQREYYSFYAIFNQTADSDQPDEAPTMPLPTPEEKRRIDSLTAAIADLEKQGAEAGPRVQSELAAWEQSVKSPVAWTTVAPAGITAGTFAFENQADGSVLVTSGGAPKPNYIIKGSAAIKRITAVRIELLTDASLPGQGPGRLGDGTAAITEVKLTASADGKPRTVGLFAATASTRAGDAAKTIDSSDTTGWSTTAADTGKPQAIVLQLIDPIEAAGGKPVDLTLTLMQQIADKSIGRFRISVTDAAQPVAELPDAVRKLLAIEVAQRTPRQAGELLAFFRPLSPTYSRIAAPLQAKKTELAAIKPVALPVMKELPADQRRKTHLLVKGNFLNPGDEVAPGLIDAFNPPRPRKSDSGPITRLEVARWLIDRENPLTARVQVNRYWSQLFGRGLVETEEDFGTQGSPPTHPELLDWLAVEFMDGGWNVKRLLKTLMMSATYRQSSRVSDPAARRDPQNLFYSHAPRFRLEAEVIRDQALALSGLLSRKMGGPSVYPPQPDGLWRAAFNGQRTWATSTGEDKFRRGLYTFLRRTVPYPSMATFDAPSRELCTLRRIRTNTPLQAFVTLNDPVYVEIAQALARRIMREGGATVEQRVRFGLELCLVRPAGDEQVGPLVDLYQRALSTYSSDATAATQMAAEPLGPLPPELKPAEAAAWTVVANILLNLDGVLTKG